MFFKRFRRERHGRNGRPQRGGHWDVQESGIEITDARGDVSLLRWSDIDEIVAFRAVAVRADEIYIEIRHNGDFTLFEETNPGFPSVRSAVETRFRVDPSWFDSIAHEPYEQDRITLYQREKIERLRPAR